VVEALHKVGKFWIIGKGDDQETIRRVDNAQARSAEFVGVDRGTEFEYQYQTRIHPEHLWSPLMVHRDVGDRLSDPATVSWELVVTAVPAAGWRSGTSLTRLEDAPKPQQWQARRWLRT